MKQIILLLVFIFVGSQFGITQNSFSAKKPTDKELEDMEYKLLDIKEEMKLTTDKKRLEELVEQASFLNQELKKMKHRSENYSEETNTTRSTRTKSLKKGDGSLSYKSLKKKEVDTVQQQSVAKTMKNREYIQNIYNIRAERLKATVGKADTKLPNYQSKLDGMQTALSNDLSKGIIDQQTYNQRLEALNRIQTLIDSTQTKVTEALELIN